MDKKIIKKIRSVEKLNAAIEKEINVVITVGETCSIVGNKLSKASIEHLFKRKIMI